MKETPPEKIELTSSCGRDCFFSWYCTYTTVFWPTHSIDFTKDRFCDFILIEGKVMEKKNIFVYIHTCVSCLIY